MNEKKQTGLGIASLVLGICAVVLGLIPLLGVVAWPLALVGLILGAIALVKKQGTIAIIGTILAIAAICWQIYAGFVIADSLNTAVDSWNEQTSGNGIEYSDLKLTSEGEYYPMYYVTGTAINNGTREYNSVTTKFDLKNDAGTIVGTCSNYNSTKTSQNQSFAVKASCTISDETNIESAKVSVSDTSTF